MTSPNPTRLPPSFSPARTAPVGAPPAPSPLPYASSSPSAPSVLPARPHTVDGIQRSFASEVLLKRSGLRGPSPPPLSPPLARNTSSPNLPSMPSIPSPLASLPPPPPPVTGAGLPLPTLPTSLPPPPAAAGPAVPLPLASPPPQVTSLPPASAPTPPTFHPKRAGGMPLPTAGPPPSGEILPPPPLRLPTAASSPSLIRPLVAPHIGAISHLPSSRSSPALAPTSYHPPDLQNRPMSLNKETFRMMEPIVVPVTSVDDSALPTTSSWTHKLSLGTIIPRLAEVPTDPTLFERAGKHHKVEKTDKCFTGETFVEWITEQKIVQSKQEAIAMGDLLLKGYMILSLGGSDTNFSAGPNDIYALVDLSAPASSKKDNKKLAKKERKAKHDEEKRLKKIEKEQKKKDKKKKEKPSAIFGMPLEEVMALQQQPPAEGGPVLPPEAANLDVPFILKVLMEKVWELDGYKSEGIFRISGSQEEVEALKKQLNEHNYCLNCTEVHVVAGCLKAWIRELPQPLVPSAFYTRCVTLGASDPKEALKILEELPELNKRVICYVLGFVCNFLKPEYMSVTKMGVENLAMIFAPLFLRNESTDPAMMLLNSGFEASFVQNLIENYLQRSG